MLREVERATVHARQSVLLSGLAGDVSATGAISGACDGDYGDAAVLGLPCWTHCIQVNRRKASIRRSKS